MNTARLTQFRQRFAAYDWTPAQRRAYARQWARSLRLLGDKWLGVPSQAKNSPAEPALLSAPVERNKA